MFFLELSKLSNLKSHSIQIPRAPPLVRFAPGLNALHHELEGLVGWARVLHHEVPEGDGVPSLA